MAAPRIEVEPAPPCTEFETLMRSGQVPSVHMDTDASGSGEKVRPTDLISVASGRAPEFHGAPAQFQIQVSSKIGGVRNVLLDQACIVNGKPDVNNTIPAGALIALAFDGASTPYNVVIEHCGWLICAVGLGDQSFSQSDAFWRIKAVVVGGSGTDESAEVRRFREGHPARLGKVCFNHFGRC